MKLLTFIGCIKIKFHYSTLLHMSGHHLFGGGHWGVLDLGGTLGIAGLGGMKGVDGFGGSAGGGGPSFPPWVLVLVLGRGTGVI